MPINWEEKNCDLDSICPICGLRLKMRFEQNGENYKHVIWCEDNHVTEIPVIFEIVPPDEYEMPDNIWPDYAKGHAE